MKKIEAFIRHEAFEPIRTDLLEKGFPSILIVEAKGLGRQKGIVEQYRGSTVTVYSSNGALKLVPDVVGKTEADAKATLQGFSIDKKDQDVTDPQQVGKVISMTPAAGTGAATGSAVQIVIGKLAGGNGGNGGGNG